MNDQDRRGIIAHWREFLAWKDYKEIQSRYTAYPREEWQDDRFPEFCLAKDYRVKPTQLEEPMWMNIYSDMNVGTGHVIFHSKADADGRALPLRIACVPITIKWIEGEGL